MPSIWIKQDDTMKEFETNVHSLLVGQAIMSLIVLSLAFLLLKSQPDFDICDNGGAR